MSPCAFTYKRGTVWFREDPSALSLANGFETTEGGRLASVSVAVQQFFLRQPADVSSWRFGPARLQHTYNVTACSYVL